MGWCCAGVGWAADCCANPSLLQSLDSSLSPRLHMQTWCWQAGPEPGLQNTRNPPASSCVGPGCGTWPRPDSRAVRRSWDGFCSSCWETAFPWSRNADQCLCEQNRILPLPGLPFCKTLLPPPGPSQHRTHLSSVQQPSFASGLFASATLVLPCSSVWASQGQARWPG